MAVLAVVLFLEHETVALWCFSLLAFLCGFGCGLEFSPMRQQVACLRFRLRALSHGLVCSPSVVGSCSPEPELSLSCLSLVCAFWLPVGRQFLPVPCAGLECL